MINDVRELCSFEGRLAGTDAERRAANRLAARLRKTAHRVDVEPTYVHPQWALVHALHTALGFAGSLLSIPLPAAGFALILLSATSLYLDANTRFYLLRRLFFRRASQNVVARGRNRMAPARIVITAHYDAARTGWMFQPSRVKFFSAIARRFPFPLSPHRIVFWSLALLIPLTGLRMAGVESQAVALLQLLPTLALLVATFFLVDIELSDVVPGANDNASGVAVALSLAQALTDDPTRNLEIWVVLTGGEECGMEGMRSFLRTHRDELDPATTYFLVIDQVGRGELRYTASEGLAVSYDLDRRLLELCEAVSAGGQHKATPIRHAFATDAIAIRIARRRAVALGTLEPGALVPSNYHLPSDLPKNVDPKALERTRGFALELIHALDRDVGRTASD
jgi:acetylornithine deacetylase/succinyl-diaminopimelate desuccinylase-like protein